MLEIPTLSNLYLTSTLSGRKVTPLRRCSKQISAPLIMVNRFPIEIYVCKKGKNLAAVLVEK